MTTDLSPEAFYESAREFAETALQAHHARQYRRVALDAGTALEHLAKACLATRSPALLSELKGEGSFQDLLRLVGVIKARPQRTVGLRGALDRVKAFVTSSAPPGDLGTLVDMRDGTVHAAIGDEVEERLVVAFAQNANAFLRDLCRDRAEFWGGQLEVVDALLADASDKVRHDVAVKLAAARAHFAGRYGEEEAKLVDLVRELSEPLGYRDDQVPAECPACESLGLATGAYEVEWEPDEWEGDQVVHVSGMVYFVPSGFECRVCRLRLDSAGEAEAAGLGRWEVENADPLKYEPPVDEDSFYEAYRDRDRD